MLAKPPAAAGSQSVYTLRPHRDDRLVNEHWQIHRFDMIGIQHE
jgi:hypothetical protein